MTNSFLKGQMQIHQSFWPEGFPGALTDTPFSYDPEKAKQILADAGVELPINVTLDTIAAQPFTDMAQSLQATFAEAGHQLRDHLGHDGPDDHEVPRAEAPGGDALLGSGLHGPAFERQGLRLQRQQRAGRLCRDDHLAELLGGAGGAERR